ncbi:MAG: 16S rRNA (cytosine(1402)-N(4))-methyltransferase RsmH [Candidatus Paceibacterota bacterium]
MHVPVLLKEAIEYLNPKEGDTILDATFGGGGHAAAICELIAPAGKLICLDQDKGTIKAAEIKFKKSKCKVVLINENFRNLDKVVEGKIDGAIFDLGFSSDQLIPPAGGPGRGFSFQKDEPLLMTLKSEIENRDLTAREIVNQWREEEIADVLYKYGEERYSRRIAKAIVERRSQPDKFILAGKKAIETTFDLVDIIRSSVPAVYRNNRRINCATRTFQALRIAVNDELNALEEGLKKAWDKLEKEGRLVVISFHSLEDRIVKNFFRDKAKADPNMRASKGKILTKKPVTPAEEEIKNNPRSRSAKMRAIIKL